jgi:hypothetical protein
VTQGVLANLTRDDIVYRPYPYAWRRDALDPAYYAELEAAFPGVEQIAGPGPLPNNRVFRSPACDVIDDPAVPAIWRDFFACHCSGAFLGEMLSFWRDAIEREYPDIESRFGKPLSRLTSGLRRYERGKPPEYLPENMRADVMLDCQFVVNSPVTVQSTVRGPHLDKPYKLFAGILYFRHPDDVSTGGDLYLYRFNSAKPHFDRRQHVDERLVEPFERVPYGPNTFVTWLNTPRALHGVSPRSTTNVPRRYINFLAECYTLRSDTFFEPRRTLPGGIHTLAKRLLRGRTIRRVQRAGGGPAQSAVPGR